MPCHPRRCILTLFVATLALACSIAPARCTADDATEARPLRIIAFGAHPDDAEFQLGGTAIRWAQLGHKVKFVSVTNGDIGHWNMAGGPLAQRRTAEVQEAARRLGIEVEVLDIHDGEIMVTLENRKTIARLIRDWQADLVFCHRPDDYHPDHRNCGLLVRDAAFMVTVPYYVPDTPRIEHPTVFMYFYDRFTKPYAFQGDVAVSIDEVLADKVHALDALESQVYEGGALGSEKFMEEKAAGDPVARKRLLAELWSQRHQAVTNKYRDTVVKWYGEQRGREIKHAEVFEICEYGYQPNQGELKRLFPFFSDGADEVDAPK
ncbi:MAG: PIG-L family deacetylase [Planctomycetaceae bacterium]|nr:PIG-L family deacetylase [Planctomycetaceae bacterium]